MKSIQSSFQFVSLMCLIMYVDDKNIWHLLSFLIFTIFSTIVFIINLIKEKS